MKIAIVAVGRSKERALRALVDDYYARVRRYAQLDEVELEDVRRADKLAEHVDRVVALYKGRAELVALEVDGRPLSSEQFARRLGERLDAAVVPVFLIGGAEGIPEEVSARAAWKLSLSTMTLPHRVARLVLAEQIYRAFTILRGEPYAREG